MQKIRISQIHFISLVWCVRCSLSQQNYKALWRLVRYSSAKQGQWIDHSNFSHIHNDAFALREVLSRSQGHIRQVRGMTSPRASTSCTRPGHQIDYTFDIIKSPVFLQLLQLKYLKYIQCIYIYIYTYIYTFFAQLSIPLQFYYFCMHCIFDYLQFLY